MKAHERWKYIEAVFVPPEDFTAQSMIDSEGVPVVRWVIGVPHPIWNVPIGKQLRSGTRSTDGYMSIHQLWCKRCQCDRLVHGTYEWCEEHSIWRLISETGLSGLALRCPETLPGDVEVLECVYQSVTS